MTETAVEVRKESPYELEFTNGLPPGTDTFDQYKNNPRPLRPLPQPKRPTPQWPPREERKGKWISKYLDQLDPETEFDQIIRTAWMYYGSDFGTALGYAAIFCSLTATPAGALAIHGGKVIRRGHQRYYETQLFNLHWAYYGACSAESEKYANDVNKIHSAIWKRVPGTYSFPWEAQTAIIGLSYFETWIRKMAGARAREIHPKIQAAYPFWGERLASYFKTEPSDGSRSMGENYPRTWEELEAFWYWFDAFDFNDQRTPDQRQKGHETAISFIDQFCELWFPRPLKFVGRSFLLTFVPPGARRTQNIGDPNPIIAFFARLFMRTLFNLGDWVADPVDPPIAFFREKLMEMDMYKVDKTTKTHRDFSDRVLMGVFSILVLALLIVLERTVRVYVSA